MDTKLVIARYKENTEWANHFENKIIYNKFHGENLLPNVGREAHTYLHHIIENYNDLNDVTIFCQGSLKEHLNSSEYRKFEDVYKNGFKGQFVAFGEEGSDKVDLFEDHLKYTFFSKEKFDVVPTNETVVLCDYWKVKKEKIIYDDAIKPFVVVPRDMKCKWAAIFAVKKESIRNNSIEFYKNMIKLVNWDNAPLGAHYLERIWSYMFIKEQVFSLSRL